MHNIHFCVVRAASAQEAESAVEDALSDWGNENNWRTICGSVSEDNKVHDCKDGRWRPGKRETIAKLNKMMQDIVSNPARGPFGNDNSERIKATLKALAQGKPVTDTGDLYAVERYIHNLYEQASNDLGKASFNILEDEYKSWNIDEVGVTRIDCPEDPVEGTKLFVVYVDMHS